MSKFYCNTCGEEVELQNGKCPKCKTNWAKIIKDSEGTDDAIPVDLEFNEIPKEVPAPTIEEIKISEEDINYNIYFFLKWAKTIKTLVFIFAIILALYAVFAFEATSGASILLLIFCPAMIVYASIIENNLRWKAYMLHTNKKEHK
jgi:hypothetical protein